MRPSRAAAAAAALKKQRYVVCFILCYCSVLSLFVILSMWICSLSLCICGVREEKERRFAEERLARKVREAEAAQLKQKQDEFLQQRKQEQQDRLKQMKYDLLSASHVVLPIAVVMSQSFYIVIRFFVVDDSVSPVCASRAQGARAQVQAGHQSRSAKDQTRAGRWQRRRCR